MRSNAKASSPLTEMALFSIDITLPFRPKRITISAEVLSRFRGNAIAFRPNDVRFVASDDGKSNRCSQFAKPPMPPLQSVCITDIGDK